MVNEKLKKNIKIFKIKNELWVDEFEISYFNQ